jgi:hypothetical protein
MQAAKETADRLEGRYDTHPDASFGESEQRARQERRQFMGQLNGHRI